MPLFEFKCPHCTNRFEELIPSTNHLLPELQCPKCGVGNPQRLMSTFSAKGIKSVSSCNSCTSSSCHSCSR